MTNFQESTPHSKYSYILYNYLRSLHDNNYNLSKGSLSYHVYPPNCHEFLSLRLSPESVNPQSVLKYSIVHRETQGEIVSAKLKQIANQFEGSLFYRHDIGTYMYATVSNKLDDLFLMAQLCQIQKNNFNIVNGVKFDKNKMSLSLGNQFWFNSHLLAMNLNWLIKTKVNRSDIQPSIQYEYFSPKFNVILSCENLFKKPSIVGRLSCIHPKNEVSIKTKISKEDIMVKLRLSKEFQNQQRVSCGFKVKTDGNLEKLNGNVFCDYVFPTALDYKYDLYLKYSTEKGAVVRFGLNNRDCISTIQRKVQYGYIQLSYLDRLLLSFGYRFDFSHFNKEY